MQSWGEPVATAVIPPPTSPSAAVDAGAAPPENPPQPRVALRKRYAQRRFYPRFEPRYYAYWHGGYGSQGAAWDTRGQ